MKLKYIVLFVCSFNLCSCSKINSIVDDFINSRINKALPSAQNAIDFIVDRLESQRIVMIGENHSYVNEELFLAENIKKLYIAGVRYFFIEGGAILENALPGSPGYDFYMFYPWMVAGWRYENILFYQALLEFNSNLPEEKQIKTIDPQTVDTNVLNERDSSNFENITRIMDNVDENIKAIALFGGGHAATKIRRNQIGSQGERYDWLPLGYRLKQYYGAGFSSYNFWLLPENDLLPEAKFLPDKTVNGLFSSSFDGFIFDKEMIGTFYQYNPTIVNIKYIFSLVYSYALNWYNIALDVPFLHFDPQGQFMMGIYYLKLYYGDYFNYDFWRIGSAQGLLSSLDEIKPWIFADDDPSQRLAVDFEYAKIALYHDYMDKSRVDDSQGLLHGGLGIVRESYLIKANETFPEDIWPLYLLGYIAYEKKQYEKALGYFQVLFKSELATCMEQLPYAYRMAANCASKINNNELEREYACDADALTNEFNIDIYDNQYFHP